MEDVGLDDVISELFPRQVGQLPAVLGLSVLDTNLKKSGDEKFCACLDGDAHLVESLDDFLNLK